MFRPPLPHRRRPLLNLMRAIGLSAGVVSRRTMLAIFVVAEAEPIDRTIDGWLQLMLGIEAVNKTVKDEPTGSVRRRHDPEPAAADSTPTPPVKRHSGVRAKVLTAAHLGKASGEH